MGIIYILLQRIVYIIGLRGTLELLHKTHRRDLIKKKAISSNDHDLWEQFKCARDQANNAIKHAKKRYFSDNLVARKGNPRVESRMASHQRVKLTLH